MAQDPNESVAGAAVEALDELKKQLEQQSMSSLLTFPTNYGDKTTGDDPWAEESSTDDQKSENIDTSEDSK